MKLAFLTHAASLYLFQNVERFQPTLRTWLGRHADVKYRRGEAIIQRDAYLREDVVDVE